MHLYSTHFPYSPPNEHDIFSDKNFSGRYIGLKQELISIGENGINLTDAEIQQMISLYDGEIHRADNNIGNILDTLDDLNLSDKTIVLISADHWGGPV